MHAVCGYPVKSTWIKAIKAGYFTGWPMLNKSKFRQVLSGDHRDTKRAFEPNQEKCTVDQPQDKDFVENRHNNTARQEGARRLH